MSDDIKPGAIVRQLNGRDRGGLCLVTGAEGDYLTLCDGRGRALDKPKRKKRKHVVKVGETAIEGELTNRTVRHILTDFVIARSETSVTITEREDLWREKT